MIVGPSCAGPGNPHPATHFRLGLCDHHYAQRQRAVSAYTSACSRVADGGPHPGDREEFINKRYTPVPERLAWLTADQLTTLRDAERELRIAEAALSKVTAQSVYDGMKPSEVAALVLEMSIAAHNAIKVIRGILDA